LETIFIATALFMMAVIILGHFLFPKIRGYGNAGLEIVSSNIAMIYSV
jgi:hypothetical protein